MATAGCGVLEYGEVLSCIFFFFFETSGTWITHGLGYGKFPQNLVL